MTLEAYSAEEHTRLLAAEALRQRLYQCRQRDDPLSDLVLWPTLPTDLSLRFSSRVKKRHTLLVISSERLPWLAFRLVHVELPETRRDAIELEINRHLDHPAEAQVRWRPNHAFR